MVGEEHQVATSGKGQDAVEPILRFLNSSHNVEWPVQALSQILPRAELVPKLVAALEKLDLHFPKVDKAERSEFKQVRQALLEEGKGSGKAVLQKVTKK